MQVCNLFTHGSPRSSQKLVQKYHTFQDWIGIWKCWFLRRGESQRTRIKTSWSRVENQQQTQPDIWCHIQELNQDILEEASALTTVPFLLPQIEWEMFYIHFNLWAFPFSTCRPVDLILRKYMYTLLSPYEQQGLPLISLSEKDNILIIPEIQL